MTIVDHGGPLAFGLGGPASGASGAPGASLPDDVPAVPEGPAARLFHMDGRPAEEATPDAVRQLRREGSFFWLDVIEPEAPEMTALLDAVGLPVEARAFLDTFGRRPCVVRTKRHAWFVLYAAATRHDLVAVHVVTSDDFVVSARRTTSPTIEALLGTTQPDYLPRHQKPDLVGETLHRLTDTVVGTFSNVLDGIDDEIDRLQAEIIERPSNDHLQQLFAMQRDIIVMRRVIVPQRDVFGRLAGEIVTIPRQSSVGTSLFRVTYDQFVRLSDLLDNYRDLVSGALDMHLSTVSNRLGEVTTQLTIIATVFLPLSFLTGFFGQNFGWLIHGLVPRWTFLVFGLGLEVAAVVFLFALFRVRGYVGSPRFARTRRPAEPRSQHG